MSIVCQQCFNVMTKSELSGYLLGEMYTVFKTVILPYFLEKNIKRGFKQNIENLLVGILNDQRVACHVCHKYIGWSSKNLNEIDDIRNYKFISKIKSLPFVQQVLLFGSRARGTNKFRSDIDLAIVCPTATSDQWQEVLDIVDDADTLLLIDCVRLDQVQDLDFKNSILKDGVRL
ncbi:MAG: nucleotidyltransferase domain-containing protein [Candidatus Babeliales bacterium]